MARGVIENTDDDLKSNKGLDLKNEEEYLLEVNNLVKHFYVTQGYFSNQQLTVHAVDDISFKIKYGETLGIVGESGCGKTTAGKTILRLQDRYEGLQTGEAIFQGQDLFGLEKEDLRQKRQDIQIIFQDPYSSLNPRMSAGGIIKEAYDVHGMFNKNERYDKAEELIQRVGLKEDDLMKYPHEFSGGQRQRIGIARALSVDPSLIICDEPISALDVSIQADILNLMKDLQKERDLSYMFISHDLNVIENFCHEIAVMYLGKIVEKGKTQNIFDSPKHYYTKALLSATPHVDIFEEKPEQIILEGDVPSPINPPSGCRFRTRCPKADGKCTEEEPTLEGLTEDHQWACHYPE